MRHITRFIFPAVLTLMAACQEKPVAEAAVLADPAALKAEQTDLTTVKLTWTDNAQGEVGYRVFLRGEGDAFYVDPLEQIAADGTSYTFTNLETGKVYDFGVQAVSENIKLHSKIVYCSGYKVLGREELAEVESSAKVAAPSDLVITQDSNVSLTLSWKDNAQDERGYNLYYREASAESFGDVAASVASDVVSYTFNGLAAGASYVFAVQAAGADVMKDSRFATIEYTMKDVLKTPRVVSVNTSYAYVAVSYKVTKIDGANPEHGVCFSSEGAPDVDDIKVYGPEIKANTEILQVVPCAYLEEGVDYQMSVYVKTNDGYLYSTPQTVRLDDQPAAVNLNWEKQSFSGAGSEVEIYKTTSSLNGRNFNAWYAIADPKKVDFRVMYPEQVGAKKSVKAQAEAAGDCLALINGAIFGNYNIGVIITEGQMTQTWHGEIEGCHWATNSQLYQITRPIIGVDADGNPGAYWVGVPQQGTFYYYDRPQASVVGHAKYGKVTSTSPVNAVSWNPYFAISCGPMVVYDGKVSADNTMVDDTHYYTNYACWDESGIYSGRPDRSAVGITDDGKIVIFICDGRITASTGASITELGCIMKEIGCKYAMNLDGGGSTGMWINGAGMINHLDYSEWRVVKSTCGFFTK